MTGVVETTWPGYVRQIAAGLTQAQIAVKTGGVSTSNVGRWLRAEPGQPDANNVVAFARAFRRPPVEALAAAGYLRTDEVEPHERTPLTEYSQSELLDELRRRITD